MEQHGRRPMVEAFENDNSNSHRMLESIRQSLSSVRLSDHEPPSSSVGILRTSSLKGQKPGDYTQNALREIRQSLKDCQDKGPVTVKRASSPADSLYSASAGGTSVAMKNSNHSHSQPLNDPVSNARLQFTMQQTRNGLGLLLCFRF